MKLLSIGQAAKIAGVSLGCMITHIAVYHVMAVCQVNPPHETLVPFEGNSFKVKSSSTVRVCDWCGREVRPRTYKQIYQAFLDGKRGDICVTCLNERKEKRIA